MVGWPADEINSSDCRHPRGQCSPFSFWMADRRYGDPGGAVRGHAAGDLTGARREAEPDGILRVESFRHGVQISREGVVVVAGRGPAGLPETARAFSACAARMSSRQGERPPPAVLDGTASCLEVPCGGRAAARCRARPLRSALTRTARRRGRTTGGAPTDKMPPPVAPNVLLTPTVSACLGHRVRRSDRPQPSHPPGHALLTKQRTRR